MGVDHKISTGIGYVVELPEEIVERDFDGYGPDYLEGALRKFPHVEYAVGGSYLGGDPVQYAILAKGTGAPSMDDLAGIVSCDEPTRDGLPHAVAEQLEAAYAEITGEEPAEPPRLLLIGLWH